MGMTSRTWVFFSIGAAFCRGAAALGAGVVGLDLLAACGWLTTYYIRLATATVNSTAAFQQSGCAVCV